MQWITTALLVSSTLGRHKPPSWADEFEGEFNTSFWDSGSWLGGWNGEFHFYTGEPSNRSSNVIVENGTLYIQPDLTANYRPGGGRPLGWQKVLGCGRTHPSELQNASSCPNPKDMPSFSLATADDQPMDHGRCAVPFDMSHCNQTSGQCIASSRQGWMPWLKKGGNCTSRSILPPVTSASMRTRNSFRFGRLEVRARLPRGDWLWPAIWLLPEESKYGGWPTSGEIDIMESRGNEKNACGPWQGRAAFGSTLHFGPDYKHNAMLHTHTESHLASGQDLSDGFHTYGLEWGPEGLWTYLDTPNHTVLAVPFPRDSSLWQRGSKWEMVCFERVDGKCVFWQPRWPSWHLNASDKKIGDPWISKADIPSAAPFDQKFYLQLNLAVGGTGSFFPDLLCKGKPWRNKDSNPRANFLADFEKWWPTWGGDVQDTERGASRSAALAIEWVRYWEPDSQSPKQLEILV
eukprot:TRINITY_DN14998_c0_g1_i1.p1 TRINITY_DN14998_c0_g1~~TRINITY_DN14998_c0_g1_i1.p1  ORF type:complete len:461 (+),score=59.41 TRINITY_DN14998_c0_g1_i1:66-1448(+)